MAPTDTPADSGASGRTILEDQATDPHGTTHWPVEVRVKREEALLLITYDDGLAVSLPAEYLRVESPSAEVQGHGPHQRVWVPGKRRVTFAAVDTVGNYALRLVFSDGHDTGIYTWKYLRELAQEQDTRWARYEAELKARGLSRDAAGHHHGGGGCGGGCGHDHHH